VEGYTQISSDTRRTADWYRRGGGIRFCATGIRERDDAGGATTDMLIRNPALGAALRLGQARSIS